MDSTQDQIKKQITTTEDYQGAITYTVIFKNQYSHWLGEYSFKTYEGASEFQYPGKNR